jgi:hypothetical protein
MEFLGEISSRATSILDNNTWDGVQTALIVECKNEKRSLRKRIKEIRL